MTVIVTDKGFQPAPAREIVALADLTDQTAVDLTNTDDPAVLAGKLDAITLIRVAFPAFSDGRAFSHASLLRSRLAFKGEVRAVGDVLIDQIPLMLRCGIDSFAVTNATALKRLAENRLPGIDNHYQPTARPSEDAGSYSWRRRA